MKSEVKSRKLKQSIEELPNKGDLGLLTSQSDPNLIRYRKQALA
jgi:hypothetical protein